MYVTVKVSKTSIILDIISVRIKAKYKENTAIIVFKIFGQSIDTHS